MRASARSAPSAFVGHRAPSRELADTRPFWRACALRALRHRADGGFLCEPTRPRRRRTRVPRAAGRVAPWLLPLPANSFLLCSLVRKTHERARCDHGRCKQLSDVCLCTSHCGSNAFSCASGPAHHQQTEAKGPRALISAEIYRGVTLGAEPSPRQRRRSDRPPRAAAPPARFSRSRGTALRRHQSSL